MRTAQYEKIWLISAGAVLVIFLLVVGVGFIYMGGVIPHGAEAVDPRTVATQDPRFSQPRVAQVAPGKYEAYVVARMFSFTPSEIRVPAGSELTLHIVSPDVTHGLLVPGTNINTMVIPGYVTTVTTTLSKTGEYLVLCHEYCGTGHQAMFSRLVVE